MATAKRVFRAAAHLLGIAAAVLLIRFPAWAQPFTVAWDPNPPEEAVTGYVLHYGTTSRAVPGFSRYDRSVDVGNVTSYGLDLPDSVTHYLAVVAYNREGLQSDYSTEVARSGSLTITSSAGPGGSISPSGTVSVSYGGSRSYTITPASGYAVAGVTVNGVSVGAVTSYTFTNVTANQTIAASFTPLPPGTYMIVASAGSSGSISPSGAVAVSAGANQSFTITPASGYAIAEVRVDGVSVGAVASYTFTNVIASRTIAASFAPITYTITSSAGTGGSISPSGTVAVNAGASQSFTIAPASGYAIADVKVDGVPVGAVASYTFQGVVADHNVEVTFAEVSPEARLSPVAFLPVSGGTVNTLQPELVVHNPMVSEPLTYEFQVGTDLEMSRVVLSGEGITQGTGVTSWTVSPSLNDKTRYYWRARTKAGTASSPWSAVQNFQVDLAAAPTSLKLAASEYLSANGDTIIEITEPTDDALGIIVSIPAGAVQYDTMLTVGSVSQPPPPTAGVRTLAKVYDLGPHGVSFAKPATIMLPYTEDDLQRFGVSGADQLGIVTFNTQTLAWEPVPVEAVDYRGMRLVAKVSHFSMYALGMADGVQPAPGAGTPQPGTTAPSSPPSAAAAAPSGGGGGGCFVATAAARQGPETQGRTGWALLAALGLLVAADRGGQSRNRRGRRGSEERARP
jgi:hypothetical protein